MKNRRHAKTLPSFMVVVTYILMIVINILANVLPLNNVSTGEVSDMYPNLFAPVSYTFLIWIVIYLLLGVYTSYQFRFNSRRPDNNDRVIRRVNTFFIVTNIINATWIISWHYNLILLSLVLMIALLIVLIIIRRTISHRSSLSKEEIQSVQVPFTVYLAWITIATIGNVTTYFVSINWTMMGVSEDVWLMIILIVSVLLTSGVMLYFKDYIYGFVILWSYGGVLFKHLSSSYFDKMYMNVIITLLVVMVLNVSIQIYVFMYNKQKKRRRSGRR